MLIEKFFKNSCFFDDWFHFILINTILLYNLEGSFDHLKVSNKSFVLDDRTFRFLSRVMLEFHDRAI